MTNEDGSELIRILLTRFFEEDDSIDTPPPPAESWFFIFNQNIIYRASGNESIEQCTLMAEVLMAEEWGRRVNSSALVPFLVDALRGRFGQYQWTPTDFTVNVSNYENQPVPVRASDPHVEEHPTRFSEAAARLGREGLQAQIQVDMRRFLQLPENPLRDFRYTVPEPWPSPIGITSARAVEDVPQESPETPLGRLNAIKKER